MGLVDKLKFKFWDDVGAVVDVIAKWSPKGCVNEKAYEKSLCPPEGDFARRREKDSGA